MPTTAYRCLTATNAASVSPNTMASPPLLNHFSTNTDDEWTFLLNSVSTFVLPSSFQHILFSTNTHGGRVTVGHTHTASRLSVWNIASNKQVIPSAICHVNDATTLSAHLRQSPPRKGYAIPGRKRR